jgi:hypothetical protein
VITIHKGDGTTRDLEHAKTGEARERLDLIQYRPPFGEAWKTAGTGKPEPEQVSITVEVWSETGGTGSTLEAIRPTLDAIIADAQAAVAIETPLGDWALEGLKSAIDQPIAAGYRLDLVWLASDVRTPADSYGHDAYGAGAYGGSA